MKITVQALVMLAVTLGAAVESASGADIHAGGCQLTLPGDWRSAGDGLWSLGADGAIRATLLVTVLPEHSSVTRAGLEVGRRELARAARTRGEEGLESWELALTRLGGAPAYRVRASHTANGLQIEQLQYVVSGRRTVALTFSTPAGDFEVLRLSFESIATTLVIEEPAGLFDEMPPDVCGAVLGVLAGFGMAARRRLDLRAAAKSLQA